MTVLETLLMDLPSGCFVSDVYVGTNWILSLVSQPDGTQQAGVASTPRQIVSESPFQIGHYMPNEKAELISNLLISPDTTSAAVGLATLNALNQPSEVELTTLDAANWLSEQSVNRSVAVFGRFPFIEDEVRPLARQVWVFEQDPQMGEFDLSNIETILPQAEVVAITGSSIINHTIDHILPKVKTDSIVALLGPSTPLSKKLFDCGVTALFGVSVIDAEKAIESVIAGDGFQKMHGLQRVSMLKSY